MASSNLDRFWLWWTGELSGLVPARMKRMSVPSQRVVVQFNGNTLELFEPKADRLKFVDRAELAGDATDNGRVTALLAKMPGRNRQVILMLASRSALVRKAMFPAATEENLRAVAGFELERLTPFKAADAAFDVKLLRRLPAQVDGEPDQIEVAVAAAPKRVVERDLARLKAAAVKVDAVAIEADLLGTPPYLDLLPPEERAAPAGAIQRALNWTLAGVAVLLLLAVVAWPIWQKRERVAALLPLVERAKLGAEVAERSNRELERRVEEYNFVLGKKHAQVPNLELLEQVSKLLPLTGWVNQYEVKPGKTGRELIVQGEVVQGTKVLELFEQSGLVQNTTFRSPLTRGATPNSERFHVAGELVVAPLPEPLSDEDLLAEARAAKDGGPAGALPVPTDVVPGTPGAAPSAPAVAPPQTAPISPPKAAGKIDGKLDTGTTKVDAKTPAVAAPDAKTDGKADAKVSPKADAKVADSVKARLQPAASTVAPTAPPPAKPAPAPTK
jgi:general secretion pathway protein L